MAWLKVFFSLLCLCGFYATIDGKRNKARGVKANELMAPGMAFSLIKPKRSGVSVGVFADECVFKCAESSVLRNATVDEDTGLFELSGPWIDKAQYDQATLLKFCSIANEFKSCVEQCPDSDSKTGFLLAYKPTTYTCNSTEFTDKLGCFKTSVAASVDCADDQHCNELNLISEYVRADFSNVENTTAYFDDICSYYKCYTECAKPKFVQNCPADGFKVFKKSLQKKIVAAKETYTAVEQRYVEPNSCSDFRNDDDYD